MPLNPLRPLPAEEFDYWKAQHLLARAGFGGSPEETRVLAARGLDGAVDLLIDSADTIERDAEESAFDPTIIRTLTQQEQAQINEARRVGNEAFLERYRRQRQQQQRADRAQLKSIRRWWLKRMIESPRPLQEKMTLFWHGHFATGYRTIENSWHMYAQNAMFRRFGVSDFHEILRRIIRDPAMLGYLNNNRNRKESPNENLARELMELFVLGEGNGYTENDIREAARALTGYSYRDNDFHFNEHLHDDGGKRVLGRSGRFNGDDLVPILLARPEASNHLCTKLVKFFVNDSPGEPSAETRSVIRGLARTMMRSKYQLKPVLRQLFRSRYFYDSANRSAVVKSPIQLIVQGVRTFQLPTRDIDSLLDAASLMGQDLLQPPSVKGWDGGRSWINTSTLFVRQNLMVYLLTGRRPERSSWKIDETPFDARHLINHLQRADQYDGDEVIDHLLRLGLGDQPHPQRLEVLRGLLRNTGNRIDNDRLVACLTIITAMPEYQLC